MLYSKEPKKLGLLLQIKLLYESLVTLNVLLLEILEVSLSISNKLKKATSRVIVLLMSFEMFCKFFNALSDESDLHFWRTSVCIVDFDLLDSFCLFCLS